MVDISGFSRQIWSTLALYSSNFVSGWLFGPAAAWPQSPRLMSTVELPTSLFILSTSIFNMPPSAQTVRIYRFYSSFIYSLVVVPSEFPASSPLHLFCLPPHPYHSPLSHRAPSAILMGQTSQIDSAKTDTKNNRHGWFQLYDSSSPASAFSRRKIPHPPLSNAASSPSSSARTARRPPASESRM